MGEDRKSKLKALITGNRKAITRINIKKAERQVKAEDVLRENDNSKETDRKLKYLNLSY